MAGLKMSVLYLGRIECKRDLLIQCEDKEKTVKTPMISILIQHPKLGNILYDLGNSPFHRTEYGQHINELYPIAEFISIEDALYEKGLTQADIDMLILSHLHFDHVGGLRYFERFDCIKNVIVAEADLKNAAAQVFTQTEGAYIKSLFDVEGVKYTAINGTVDLADDLTLFVQESHTPGCIGMIVKTENNGNFIITSDAIYLKDSYETMTPPGGTINKTTEEFYQNAERIKALQKQYHAEIIFSHDYEQAMEWSKKGKID